MGLLSMEMLRKFVNAPDLVAPKLALNAFLWIGKYFLKVSVNPEQLTLLSCSL
jgi:hypothetical protein